MVDCGAIRRMQLLDDKDDFGKDHVAFVAGIAEDFALILQSDIRDSNYAEELRITARYFKEYLILTQNKIDAELRARGLLPNL